MASLPAPEHRKWFYLGLRHLRMAHRLLRSNVPDGAVFHAYHSFECILSALIAAKGYPVPPGGWTSLRLPSGETIQAYPSPLGAIRDRNAHTARLVFFDQLADRAQPYYRRYRRLRALLTYRDRLDAFYFDVARERLPEERYSASFATELMAVLTLFAGEIRVEIP
jgi:hypothetical protein